MASLGQKSPTRARARTWTAEGYDGEVHYGSLATALLPAACILAAASGLIFAVL